jgi:hypothetical protein
LAAGRKIAQLAAGRCLPQFDRAAAESRSRQQTIIRTEHQPRRAKEIVVSSLEYQFSFA